MSSAGVRVGVDAPVSASAGGGQEPEAHDADLAGLLGQDADGDAGGDGGVRSGEGEDGEGGRGGGDMKPATIWQECKVPTFGWWTRVWLWRGAVETENGGAGVLRV